MLSWALAAQVLPPVGGLSPHPLGQIVSFSAILNPPTPKLLLLLPHPDSFIAGLDSIYYRILSEFFPILPVFRAPLLAAISWHALRWSTSSYPWLWDLAPKAMLTTRITMSRKEGSLVGTFPVGAVLSAESLSTAYILPVTELTTCFFFLTMIKYTEHKVYHLDHF